MNISNKVINTGLSPIIKWAGGKEKELSVIIPNAPQNFVNYYEPFVGGGSVFAAFPATHHFINDKSQELISLYKCVAEQNEEFFWWINSITKSWLSMLSFVGKHKDLCQVYVDYRIDKYSDISIKEKIDSFLKEAETELQAILAKDFVWERGLLLKEVSINLSRKISRMKILEKKKRIMPDSDVFDNIETAFMSALYMYFRELYNNKALMDSNHSLATALFVFIRNYAYSGMFRYNDKGQFNVPYGGISYNHKLLSKKIDYYKSEGLSTHFQNTSVFNMDFEDFFRHNPPKENDFVFLDPPYDTEFSEYAQNEFSKQDQQRLADYLINECKGKWMLVIKNTPFIYSLYNNPKLTIKTFDKTYLVSFMNRNNKKAEHLLIMNYGDNNQCFLSEGAPSVATL